MGVGRISPFPIWMGLRGFSAWGIQTGPFAALSAHFVLRFFQLFHFLTGERAVFYTQRKLDKSLQKHLASGIYVYSRRAAPTFPEP